MKKAQGLSLRTIVIAILVFIVLTTTLYAVQRSYSPFAKTLTKEGLRARQEQCKLEGIRSPNLLRNDNDNYPNSCDICPWYDSSEDLDIDYMPDGCDEDKYDSTKSQCLHGFNREKNYCYEMSEEEREKSKLTPQEIKEKTAQEKLDKALEAIENQEYYTAYGGVIEIIRDHINTPAYDKSLETFKDFESYYTDEEDLLIFYKDAIDLLPIEESEEYQLSLLKLYNDMLGKYTYPITKPDVVNLEKILKDLEKFAELEYFTAKAENQLSAIYYQTGDKFVSVGERKKAITYFKIVFTKYPNSTFAVLAKRAYEEALVKQPS